MTTRSTTLALFLAAAACSTAFAQPGPPLPPPLLPPPVPPQNPITEAKRALGKMLFWDEQLSTNNAMSCGSCHTAARGGADARSIRTPGFDGLFNTPDDVFGSPGVINADAANDYQRDAVFGTGVQGTGRTGMPVFTAAYAPDTFWDGRARSTFIDPETGAVVIPNGGGLESQAVGPPLSDVEMAHSNRNWPAINEKLRTSRPLALATALPPDVAVLLTPDTRYPQLFEAAFGTETISAARIAMAIATYERTLVPNQTPADLAAGGNPAALTPNQRNGFNAMVAGGCTVCHGGSLFSGNGFRNIGVRPAIEDLGRQIVTGLATDAGRMKVPSLRNVGLRTTFMHHGQMTTIVDVIRFYAQAPGSLPQFTDNLDPAADAVVVPPQNVNPIDDFLRNGLTDPRVAARTFPFDEPTLYFQRPADRPAIIAGGVPGTGGGLPTVIAVDPPLLGNTDFRLGLQGGLAGARARVVVSTNPPINGRVEGGELSNEITLTADGVGTMHWSIPTNTNQRAVPFFLQWIVDDPAAADGSGQARSNIARITPFCAGAGCPACTVDFDNSGQLDSDDIGDFITTYFGGGGQYFQRDFNADGSVNPDDLGDYITGYFMGCA
ncbi:MAG: cytochrome-c peroxidase [Phycisphaerales bacterium]